MLPSNSCQCTTGYPLPESMLVPPWWTKLGLSYRHSFRIKEDPPGKENSLPTDRQGVADSSRTWRHGVSVLVPSLTFDSLGQHTQQQLKVTRKATEPNMAPTEPPPPYNISDHKPAQPTTTILNSPTELFYGKRIAPRTVPNAMAPPSNNVHPQINLSRLSISTMQPPQPQIMPPTPPSPLVKRTTLFKSQPAAEVVAPAMASAMASAMAPVMAPVMAQGNTSGDESSGGGGPKKPTKLYKQDPSFRQRSASLQQPDSNQPPFEFRTSRTIPINHESRGRTVSAQHLQPGPTPEVQDASPRVVSTPVAPTVRELSPSPSRNLLRRSWLPGGRSRSNSIDLSRNSGAYAWVMSDDSQPEYNYSLLKNAEKVRKHVYCSRRFEKLTFSFCQLGARAVERKRVNTGSSLPKSNRVQRFFQSSRIRRQFVLRL